LKLKVRVTYALKNDGTLVGWGYNDDGQINTPSTATNVTQVACGRFHTYAIRAWSDCNANGTFDGDDIAYGGAADTNANGSLDACEQAQGDIDLSSIVDYGDVALIMLDFGPCAVCLSDLDGTGVVDFGDVAMALLNFGPVN
jgi:alpha-tubulin suppressor-like RCC1 family protein